jgi:hypothetical protein
VLIQSSKKYLRLYLSALFLLLLSTIAFNLIIDPFGVYNFVDIQSINNVKTGQGNHVRMGKAGAVRSFKPRAIVLGNSRAEYGINPEHPGWKVEPVYNLGVSGSNIYESLRYFQHAHSIQPLDKVLIMLDLNLFDAYWENAVDFSEERLAVSLNEQKNEYYYLSDFIPTTLSLNALTQSINTIWRSATNKTTTYLSNGQRDWRNDLLFRTVIRNFGSYQNIFTIEEKSLLEAKAKGYSSDLKKYSYNQRTKINVFDWFRKIVKISIRDNIDLHLVLTPSHARYFEMHRLMGNWTLWEEWKRALVDIVEEEAKIAGVTPFPFWDFSGFTPLTTEYVPAENEKDTKMEWYFESSHFTTDLGDLIQDKVFNRNILSNNVPDYFGVLITSKNIDEHLEETRVLNLRFREEQPNVAKELQELASKYIMNE